MDSTKLKNQIRKFEEHLVVDRGLSKVTVGGYSRTISIALRRMRKFVPQHPEIKSHILWMHDKEYSYSHIVNTSMALEHYTRFKGNPIKLGRPKKPRQIIQNILTESEISRLIHSTGNIREKAVVCLLAYSGIRNAELCGLRVRNVDLGSNQATIVSGKNKKDRFVNISPECTKVLVEYLRAYPREADELLFTTLAKNNELATGDVRKLIRTLGKRVNIARRVYPHLLRHSLATNLLSRGASLMMIRDQLGHVFIESTMIYATSLPFRNRSEYDFYKPAYM